MFSSRLCEFRPGSPVSSHFPISSIYIVKSLKESTHFYINYLPLKYNIIFPFLLLIIYLVFSEIQDSRLLYIFADVRPVSSLETGTYSKYMRSPWGGGMELLNALLIVTVVDHCHLYK